MKIRYSEFLRIYEKNNYVISLADVDKVIKDVFSDTKVSSVSTLYEKEDDINKLIITINNLFYDETNIIHTKLVFYVDESKKKLTKNHLHYQYDINCNYKQINFSDVMELETKLKKVLDNRKFGRDIKILSDLSVTISSDVNKLLEEEKITSLSVYSITYVPIVDAVPCDALTFRFDINIDDTRFIKMIIKKIDKDEFRITFNENDWFEDTNIGSLRVLPQTITDMIKNHVL